MEQLENFQYTSGYNLETVDCPLCGGKKFKKLLLERNIPIVRCRGCDLVFANPRPNAEGLKLFYDQYFPPESAPLWQKQMSGIFQMEGLKQIERYQKNGTFVKSGSGKILDVGCGMGFFLDLMRKQSWGVKGIEPSAEAAKHARDVLKLDVFHGTIESWHIDEPLYDVVTLWYVLEHVPNPISILNRVFQVLKPGGLLIVRVPNQNVPIDQLLSILGLGRFFLMNPPRHLFDYSPKTLRKLLSQSGFSILDIRNGIPRKTGTLLELIRRYAWYYFFEFLSKLSYGRMLRGSSITVYAQKKL